MGNILRKDSASASAEPTAPTTVDESAAPKNPRSADAKRSPCGCNKPKQSQARSDAVTDGTAVPFDLHELEAELESLRASPPPYLIRVGTLVVPTLVCGEDGQMKAPEGPGPWDLTVCIRGGFTDQGEVGAAAQEVAAAKQELEEAKRVAWAPDKAAAPAAVSNNGSFTQRPSVGTWLLPPLRAAAAVGSRRLEVAKEKLQLAQERHARAAAKEKASKSRTAQAYEGEFQLRLRFDADWPLQPPAVRFQGVIHHALVDDNNGMLTPFYRTLPTNDAGIFTVGIILAAVHDFLIDPLESWGISLDKAPQRLLNALQTNQSMNEQRLDVIRKYSKLVKHRELFTSPPAWEQRWFAPAFWRAQEEKTPEAWRAMLTEHLEGEVFSFDMFTEDFCDLLVEELLNFYASGLPAKRPNSMNNYGIILNEIGLEPFITRIQEALQPLGELLWPGPGSVWDGHHCFIVRYREKEDLGLDMHTDDSDVTFNVCLGLDFKGAGLQFCGIMGAPNHRKHTMTYQHVKGKCVCHLGRKRHGADDISSGERLNLILWNHSSTYRQSEDYTDPPYKKEEGPPDQVCVSYTHDRDYGIFKPYPKGKEHFQGRGWCPPRDYVYLNFKAD